MSLEPLVGLGIWLIYVDIGSWDEIHDVDPSVEGGLDESRSWLRYSSFDKQRSVVCIAG